MLEEIESMDCLIVIGTALETSLASHIVGLAIKKKKLIIEINTVPCIRYGKVKQLIGRAQDIVPNLCYMIQDQIIQMNGDSK